MPYCIGEPLSKQLVRFHYWTRKTSWVGARTWYVDFNLVISSWRSTTNWHQSPRSTRKSPEWRSTCVSIPSLPVEDQQTRMWKTSALYQSAPTTAKEASASMCSLWPQHTYNESISLLEWTHDSDNQSCTHAVVLFSASTLPFVLVACLWRCMSHTASQTRQTNIYTDSPSVCVHDARLILNYYLFVECSFLAVINLVLAIRSNQF
jgi:hypothetical protein